MISELALATGHHSFWNRTFPFISRVVRKLNLEKMSYTPPLNSGIDPSRRALVNEAGFRLFEFATNNALDDARDVAPETLQGILKGVETFIDRFMQDSPPEKVGACTDIELKEAFEMSKKLQLYFSKFEPQKKVLISPYFKGCGILNDCQGDVLIENTLYEIKGGDRDFRALDIKQLLVYCALRNSEHNLKIDFLGLVNPRNGIYSIIAMNDAIEIATGVATQDALLEIINYLDSPQDFR